MAESPATSEELWEKHFHKLQAYKETHGGDCNVPDRWSEDPALGSVGLCRKVAPATKPKARAREHRRSLLTGCHAPDAIWRSRSLQAACV